jgi:hypothetical protein
MNNIASVEFVQRIQRGLQSQQDIFLYILSAPRASYFALHLCLSPMPSFFVFGRIIGVWIESSRLIRSSIDAEKEKETTGEKFCGEYGRRKTEE